MPEAIFFAEILDADGDAHGSEDTRKKVPGGFGGFRFNNQPVHFAILTRCQRLSEKSVRVTPKEFLTRDEEHGRKTVIPRPRGVRGETQYFSRVINSASASASKTRMVQGRPSARKVIASTT